MASSLTIKTILTLSLWALLISHGLSLTCTSQTFTNNKLYTHCLDLPTLTSYLHFTYDESNTTLSIAFIATPSKSNGWIAWAINPTGTGMAGAQSLVAYKDPSTAAMTVKTYNISSYSSVVQSKLDFEVWDLRGEEMSDGSMMILGKVKVPEELAAKGTVNQIWQVGPGVGTGGMLEKHAFLTSNLDAKGTLDLKSGESGGASSGGGSRAKKKNIHGILNTVSWGILLPFGAIIARYLRTFEAADPAWFYLHAICQFSGYVVGVTGWGTGLKLGSESKGVQYTGHRNIGIALFCLATVQIFALFIRPKKDHKFRSYWNIYHHGLGYAILILGILNVFKGFDILMPEKKWKSAYIIVIGSLAVIAVLLEAITWIIIFKRKSSNSTKPYDGYNNNNGSNRQQPVAI